MPSVINGRSLILPIYLLELMRHGLFFFFFFWLHWVFTEVRGLLYLQCPDLLVLKHVGSLALQPGIEPVSPALEGRFLTSGPPEKPQKIMYFRI